MTAEQHLYNLLTGDPEINAILNGRVYPRPLPQEVTYPAVMYFRVSAFRDRTMNGPSGLAQIRLQTEVWAKNYKSAKDLAELIREKMDGLTQGEIQDIDQDNDFDFYEEGDNLVQAQGVAIDFIFSIDE